MHHRRLDKSIPRRVAISSHTRNHRSRDSPILQKPPSPLTVVPLVPPALKNEPRWALTLIKFQNCAPDSVGGFDFEDSHGFDVGQGAEPVASSIHVKTPGSWRARRFRASMRFRGWHEAGPHDASERERDWRIVEILGIGNPLVEWGNRRTLRVCVAIAWMSCRRPSRLRRGATLRLKSWHQLRSEFRWCRRPRNVLSGRSVDARGEARHALRVNQLSLPLRLQTNRLDWRLCLSRRIRGYNEGPTSPRPTRSR